MIDALPLLLGPEGYQISRSVRLRSSASAYLNRTPASASNRTTWTWSGWAKLGSGLLLYPLDAGAGTGIGVDVERIQFGTGNGLYWQRAIIQTSTTYQLQSSAVFRDPSAWYHLVLVWDSSNATSTERMRAYVNGVRLTTSAYTAPSQNQNSLVNASTPHKINRNDDTSSNYGDGYLTEIHFIDGQALTPSSFGSTNSVTGVWQPIKYTGTYGTNGFYLNFSDNSGVTATTIGKDYSGNGNNWTPSAGISITAGVTYDSMLDVPTLYADGGNGRGNYSVLNPVNVSGGGTTTITDGNLATSVGSTTTFGKVLGSVGMSTGKWYWEVLVTAVGGAGNIGIGDGTPPSGSFGLGGVAGEISYQSTGNKYTNNSSTAYGATYTTNDLIGVAYDADAGSITFYKNNASQGAITGFSGTKYAAVGSGGGTNPQYAINFGQRPFTYTPPTGFVALNTQNLPTPTISNGATVMAATLWTGDGTNPRTITNTVNGVSFQPDLVWTKARSQAYDHSLYDSVRGATNYLISNSTAAEASAANTLQAFNSNGFQVGGNNYTNSGSATYVAWQWNAGGSTVTNTSGTISSQVRANATAGFSVVTYTGTGANATVGHGLGVAPKMVIVKDRSNAGNEWAVYHANLTSAAYYIALNTTAAQSLAGAWNSTAPTSSLFTVGGGSVTNQTSHTYVAYCFAAVAGYSAFGSYTGNGSTDGPFVFLGFRPRFLMVKRTDVAANWIVEDTSRSTYNVTAAALYPNLSNAEDTSYSWDILSNGFKIRDNPPGDNASSGTFIYAAFAENPFKLSLAR